MICIKCTMVLSEERGSEKSEGFICDQCVEKTCAVCLKKKPMGLMTETEAKSERVPYRYLICSSCSSLSTSEIAVVLLNRISFQKQIMKAAAVEIEEYWVAHCDQDGYGPINLLDYLECKRNPTTPPYPEHEEVKK